MKLPISMVLACCSLAAHAQLISMSDFSGSETVETFDPGFGPDSSGLVHYHDLTIRDRGWGYGYSGLTGNYNWGQSGYFNNIPGASGGNAMNDFWNITDITIAFSSRMTRVGLLVVAGHATNYILRAYDSTHSLLASGTATTLWPTGAVFMGLESQNNDIAFVELLEPDGDNQGITLMDDVRYEMVPEPASMAILALGAAALGARKRRKAQVSPN